MKKLLIILIILGLVLFTGNKVLAQSAIQVSVNPAIVKNTDFAQLLGGYLNPRANLDPNSKFTLAQTSVINEAKKMFPQSPEFPNAAVMRTQSNKMLENDYFVITNEEVEDVIKFCSQARCDPMFGAIGEGPVETHNGVSGKAISTDLNAIKARASFVKSKCQQYFGDNNHCLHWDIGNEPPSPVGSCDFYGGNLLPNSMLAVKEIIPNAIFHAPELFNDATLVRDQSITIGECIAKKLQEVAPDFKIDVVSTHWYPYICNGQVLNITGAGLLNWNGSGGPVYQKMTYPQSIASTIGSWLSKYNVTRNSVISIGELNPMSACIGTDQVTSRLNLTWGSAFWHLDVLGIMAESGIKYCQKHGLISGGNGLYDAMVVGGSQVTKTTAYFAYRFYSQSFANKVVQSSSSNAAAVNSHAGIDKDGNLRLLLINKTSASQRVNVSLSNFSTSGTGTAYLMKAPDFGEPSSFNESAIYTTRTNIPVSNNFNYDVEAYTAVILKINGTSSGGTTVVPAATATSEPHTNVATATPIPAANVTYGPGNNPGSCPAGLPARSSGNADCNGTIDGSDLRIWKEEFLGTRNTKQADFNNNGKVNGFDFILWWKGRD